MCTKTFLTGYAHLILGAGHPMKTTARRDNMGSYSAIAKIFLDAFRDAADISSEWFMISDPHLAAEGTPAPRDPHTWILSKFPDGWTIEEFPDYPLIIISPADVDFDVTVEGMGEGRSIVSGRISVHLMHRGRIADFDALSDSIMEFLRAYPWTDHGIYIKRISSTLLTTDIITRPTKFYHRRWDIEFEVVE